MLHTAGSWKWPRLPSSAQLEPSAEQVVGQAVLIEVNTGAAFDASLLAMEPAVGTLRYRCAGDAWAVTLPFSRLRRLTLTTPIAASTKPHGTTVSQRTAAVVVSAYRLDSAEAGKEPLTGVTAGHVDAREGLYLFTPVEGGVGLQRIFVPRSAYRTATFGRSAVASAARPSSGITDPSKLLAALEAQRRLAVEPLGQSLIKLGLLTPGQLQDALERQKTSHLPLGQALIESGHIRRPDLEKALAHKMGYPMVDLVRFPIQAEATEALPLPVLVRTRVVPLLIDRTRLVVAIHKPSATLTLRELQTFTGLTLVPVIAQRSALLDALATMSERGVWGAVPSSMRFFATTV